MDNSTSVQLETQLTTGPAPVVKPRPTQALLREALTAFHVKAPCRATAWELYSYWQPGGAVFPLVSTLAEGVGRDVRTVQRHLKQLQRVGIWVRLPRHNHANRYDFRLPGFPWGDTSVTPNATPVSPRMRHQCHPEVLNEVFNEESTPIPPSGGSMYSSALLKPRRQKRAEKKYRQWWSETHKTPLPDNPSNWPQPYAPGENYQFDVVEWFETLSGKKFNDAKPKPKPRKATRSTDRMTFRIDAERRARKSGHGRAGHRTEVGQR